MLLGIGLCADTVHHFFLAGHETHPASLAPAIAGNAAQQKAMLRLWLLLLTLFTLVADLAELWLLDRTHGGAGSTAVLQAEGRRPSPDVLVACAVC